MNDFILRTKDHAEALKNHTQTSEVIKKEMTEEKERSYASTLETWDKAYRSTQSSFDEENTLSDDEVKLADELGIKFKEEVNESNLIASKVIVGQSGMKAAIDMVHKGRIYPVLKAKNAILEKQLKERDALIAKLRGGGTSGGESSGTDTTPKKKQETREEWQQRRFGANRPELQRG